MWCSIAAHEIVSIRTSGFVRMWVRTRNRKVDLRKRRCVWVFVLFCFFEWEGAGDWTEHHNHRPQPAPGHPTPSRHGGRVRALRGDPISCPGENTAGLPRGLPASLASSPPTTLVPLGDRAGRHGERAPAVSRQRSRPLTSVSTSTSGAKVVTRAVGGA